MRLPLMLLVVFLTPCASAAADPKLPDALPGDVVQTWEEAEAQLVWIGPSKYRFLGSEERREDLGARAVPGFWFKSWNPGLLANVASPDKPFGVVQELRLQTIRA